MDKKKKKVSDTMLLRLFAETCRARARDMCEYPGCKVNASYLQVHHVFSRRHASLRYDPENGICLCATHHTLGNYSAHRDPTFLTHILRHNVRTQEWLDKLIEKRNIVVKNNQEFKEKCYEKLLIIRKEILMTFSDMK